jgi:hypothetical protein
MKKLITTGITFNPAVSQITFDIEDFQAGKIYAIINQSAFGEVIYATGTPGVGFSAVSGNTVTLQYSCVAMSANDILQVVYDDDEDLQFLAGIYEMLEKLSFLTSVRGVSADLRTTVLNTVAATISSGTLTALTTLGNQSAIGGFQANAQIPAIQNIATAQGNINNIQVTIS